MMELTISSKNTIVIPREARQGLGFKAGDKLLAVVRDGRLIVLQKPKRHRKTIRGLADRPYPEGYVETERRGWD